MNWNLSPEIKKNLLENRSGSHFSLSKSVSLLRAFKIGQHGLAIWLIPECFRKLGQCLMEEEFGKAGSAAAIICLVRAALNHRK